MFGVDKGRRCGRHTPVDKSSCSVDPFGVWLAPLCTQKCAVGDGMKGLILALGFVGAGLPALAGGLGEPAMDPAVVAADAASSASDSWVGVVMTLLVFGVAIAN